MSKYRTFIIAEAGVNHNGSLELAKKLVDVAVEAGADAVKFQTFKAANLVTKAAKQASYQVENMQEESSQYEMLKKLELSYEEFNHLKNYCDTKQIEFLSTPFDFESVDFLVDTLKMGTVKIPSGELTNAPFIHYIATKRKPMIVSTGMATIEEIVEALCFIAYGLAFPEEKVDLTSVRAFYLQPEARKLLQEYVTILHCTTAYPTPEEDVNLRAMTHLQQEFQVSVGLSDHSEGTHASVAAVAREAKVIEKHFTISRHLPGPDHLASLEPRELQEMIKAIRSVEKLLGNEKKQPSQIEIENKTAARKSLVAARAIIEGEQFTENNLSVKRPGNGMSPSLYWSLLGKKSTKNYKEDELIDE